MLPSLLLASLIACSSDLEESCSTSGSLSGEVEASIDLETASGGDCEFTYQENYNGTAANATSIRHNGDDFDVWLSLYTDEVGQTGEVDANIVLTHHPEQGKTTRYTLDFHDSEVGYCIATISDYSSEVVRLGDAAGDWWQLTAQLSCDDPLWSSPPDEAAIEVDNLSVSATAQW